MATAFNATATLWAHAALADGARRPHSTNTTCRSTRPAGLCLQAAAVGGPLTAGMVVGMVIAPDVLGWYQKLKKPTWEPPNWLFGPMWSLLYCMMGVASHRVWLAGGGPLPLTLYGVQLLLNLAWRCVWALWNWVMCLLCFASLRA